MSRHDANGKAVPWHRLGRVQ